MLAPYDIHSLPARLDVAAAVEVERALLRDGGGRVLILDFTHVSYIDPRGILGLTRAADASRDRRIVLASLSSYATTIAQLTHLHDTFDIYASVDAAMCAVLDADDEATCTTFNRNAL